ncbi:hypothetical protein F4777DRAFT_565729 [Nemania sp. FL0916]|nr:hypothetical protein F4777DRAFT_565729 [Nemania sp. FL0916]
MPPVTRRAAKALAEPPKEEPTKTTATAKGVLFEEPIALRSRPEIYNDAAGEDEDRNSIAASPSPSIATPARKRIEVHVDQDGDGDEDGIASKKSTRIEVLIPSSALKTPLRSSPVPDSQDSSGSSFDADQTLEPLSASKQLEEEAAHKLATQSQLEPGLESTPVPKSKKAAKPTPRSSEKKRRGQASPELGESESEAEAEAEVTPRPKPAKSTHVVFGDDDDVDQFVAAAAEKENTARNLNAADEDNEEGDASDDEAPEAVSTTAAARETLKSARAATEAAKQYAESTKRKRQARDNLLKQQASKRKRTMPDKARKGDASGDEDEEQDQDVEEEEEDEKAERAAPSKRQKRSHKLPDMLPAEFLTDSSDSSDDEDDSVLKKKKKIVQQRPRKITFDTALRTLGASTDGNARPPPDEVVGTTRYRVLAAQSDPRLAPKANKNSRRVREELLRRGRERVVQNKRRGFFVRA